MEPFLIVAAVLVMALCSRLWVDLAITPANVLRIAGATFGGGYAGEVITAGQTLCIDTTGATLNLFKAKCSGIAAYALIVGIAENNAAAGQWVQYQVTGRITIGATVVVGTPYYASATFGGICPFLDLVTGNYCSRLGDADTATTITLAIANTGIIHA